MAAAQGARRRDNACRTLAADCTHRSRRRPADADMTNQTAPGRIFELFEFTPDGLSRPPDGPGMYTWMLRRAQGAANLERVTLPRLDSGNRGALLAFPDDVSLDTANAIAAGLRAHPRLHATPVRIDSGTCFRATWRQGEHDWSPRATCLVLDVRDESLLVEAASLALASAACDCLLVASPFRRNMCVAYANAAPDPRPSGFWSRWRRKRAPDAWRDGKRPLAPLPGVRAITVRASATFLHQGATSITVRHAHWLRLVTLCRLLCTELDDSDERLLTDRAGRTLDAAKALALMLALRELLQANDQPADTTAQIREARRVLQEELGLREHAENLYQLLCKASGITAV